jgi:hypothetical protein
MYRRTGRERGGEREERGEEGRVDKGEVEGKGRSEYRAGQQCRREGLIEGIEESSWLNSN